MVAAVLIALLIKTFLLQAFYIPSGSMQPTLRKGDRVLVEKVAYRFDDPERGDVIVFERAVSSSALEPAERGLWGRVVDSVRALFGWPTGGRRDFIKRVVAVAGDTVEARGGDLYVNGDPVAEPYLGTRTQTSSFPARRVPQGAVFVMGDNRGDSKDSRTFGAVALDDVVGRAFLLVWPPRDFATL